MPVERQVLGVPSHEDAGAASLVRFAQALGRASTLEELGRRFVTGFGSLMAVPMYGFNLLDPDTGQLQYNVAPHVSDVFVARYARKVMDEDPLRVEAFTTGRPAYNLQLMSVEEWGESFAYREAYSLHAMRHVVEAPIAGDGEVLGGVHFATSDPSRNITAREVQLTGAVGRLLGIAIEQMRSAERTELERDRALAALEATETAVVFSDRGGLELAFTEAAKRLLSQIVNPEERIPHLLVRPDASSGFARRIAVELVDGGTGVLHGHSSPVPTRDGSVVTVLELEHDDTGVDPRRLAGLTPREREVAVLVVEGLADREIAERLSLSIYTVNQYAKRIYRKLDVTSRVELTRLLLAGRAGGRRS